MTLGELEQFLKGMNEQKFRAAQLFAWISRGARSFGEMRDLGLSLRKKLDESSALRSSVVAKIETDRDGAVKLGLLLGGGAAVEAVLLPANGRYTACLSTQAGCPVGCVFCKTGSLGFLRNLSAAEIVEQFLELDALCAGNVSNIVVMGMGEPLLNLEALRKALEIITSPEGRGLSKRRITISTSGIIAGIAELAEKGPDAELALSITTAREDLRGRLIKGAGPVSLRDLKNALVRWQQKHRRRITLETVLLGGINTGGEDAEALVRFARGLRTVVNIIPWNPVEGLSFEGNALVPPAQSETAFFRRQLESAGLNVTCRFRRGRGISGACGQLGALPDTGK
ncbi:MAG: 23S rRNA (adenine(2503)-C(2))-methyltransferase RlmN [Treponema sp.]|nr:23S rRNA (adenine(2503)-C(2))-methyltransferase RlmN [Treponema sp.]